MSKILVTGASGELGGATIRALLKRVDAAQVVAVVRDIKKAGPLEALGVEVRRGDYSEPSSLFKAFKGVEKVLMISTVAFTDRLPQHLNVISAAKAAGVHHLVYTSIQRTDSPFEISMVTQSDIDSEKALIDSGLAYTILRNCLYLDVLPLMLGADVMHRGVQMTAGGGKAPLVTRADLAEANAVVLTEPGHEDRVYTLGASESFSFEDVALELSGIAGKSVPYLGVSNEVFVGRLVDAGFPKPVADFLSEWSMAVSQGEFSEVTGDLERLIGRPPVQYKPFLRNLFRTLH